LWESEAGPLRAPNAQHAAGGLTHVEVAGHGADATLLTYVPTRVNGERPGVIELRESMRPRQDYVRASLLRTGVATVGIAAWCAVLASVLGVSLVGRPIGKLVEQARRIGGGELGARVELPGRYELSELATEMNAMAERLAGAQSALASETSARLVALEQLRHAERLATVGKLASGVAHELGTPLNVVSGRAKLVEQSPGAAEAVKRDARIVREQADRMAQIIRQLLDFARAGEPHSVLCDAGELVSQTLALLAPVASKRKVSLALEAGGKLPRFAADPGQIQQVIANLVVNAVQATEPDGEVNVALARETAAPPKGGPLSEYLVVRVSDHGAGMSDEVLARVFEPFFTTKGVGEGTGLGLSVAHGIVEEHGGFILAESQKGQGSRFSVFLPLPGRA
jgi:signal transduction histidine kinase